jgi:hypothetical protein
MIYIPFIEPQTQDWTDWKELCDIATQQLIDNVKNGQLPVITDLYKGQKHVYFDLHNNFYGKCAYCETLIVSNQPGDVEHYRPKGRLTDANNKVITVDNNGTPGPHLGYYWLAYQFTNLLPSCIDCNRPSKGNSGGNLIGKWDKFPVDGINAINPGEHLQENDLLINPTVIDPEGHLMIDNLGILHSKTIRGKNCIDMFGLNIREALVNERKSTYDAVKNLVTTYLISVLMNATNNQQLLDIQSYKDGKRPYSIAGRKALSDIISLHNNIFNQLN